MNELFQILHYIVLFSFPFILLIITINNIWRRTDIKRTLQIIRYLLIGTGIITLLRFTYFFITNFDSINNGYSTGEINPFSASGIPVIAAIMLPFFLFINKLGRSKYFILLVSFLIIILPRFERIVILITSLYRGHMPASWASYYPTWQELPVFIVKILLISTPFILLIVNLVVYIIRKIKPPSSTRV